MDTPMDLSPERMQTLVSVLDEIIPPRPDGRLPGAGQLGLAEPIARDAALRAVLEPGLDALEELARGKGAVGFAELESDVRRAVLDEVSALAPALVPTLVAQAILGYYQDLRVWQGIGLEPRPPHPQGYEVEPTNFSILDPVREREPFYREP